VVDSTNAANSPHIGISELSYEEARSRLVEIVTRLEQGSISLEESLVLWEQGEALARHCQSWLDGARERLQAAQEQQPNARPADPAAANPATANPAANPATANESNSEDIQ